jgi:hypothetical protein
MELEDYEALDGEALRTKIQSLSRSDLDEQLQQFGTQYALLCQRLEAVFNREARFAQIRPGGLKEIDQAIYLAEEDYKKELSLLKTFRELNRILLPFMDVYEAHVLSDLKHMSKEELQTLHTGVLEQLKAAGQPQMQDPANYRNAQNASGMFRLATLMKEAIRDELKNRFGSEPAA